MLLINKSSTHLLAHFETGTEGVLSSVYTEKTGYDGLYVLNDGDELIVYTKNRGAIIWKGIVQLEYERLYQACSINPQNGQQAINGYRVHGFQTGLEPHIWAEWFFEGLPAALLRYGSSS